MQAEKFQRRFGRDRRGDKLHSNSSDGQDRVRFWPGGQGQHPGRDGIEIEAV